MKLTHPKLFIYVYGGKMVIFLAKNGHKTVTNGQFFEFPTDTFFVRNRVQKRVKPGSHTRFYTWSGIPRSIPGPIPDFIKNVYPVRIHGFCGTEPGLGVPGSRKTRFRVFFGSPKTRFRVVHLQSLTGPGGGPVKNWTNPRTGYSSCPQICSPWDHLY